MTNGPTYIVVVMDKHGFYSTDGEEYASYEIAREEAGLSYDNALEHYDVDAELGRHAEFDDLIWNSTGFVASSALCWATWTIVEVRK